MGKQGRINCETSSEPEIIQNDFLLKRRNWREKEVEGETERERENDGWINREKEEVEDLYLSFSKVSSLTRVTTVKSVLTLSIT